MQYRTLSPAEIRPGDRIRRFGVSRTVVQVTPVTDHGTFEITFQNGEVARVATICVIDEQPFVQSDLINDVWSEFKVPLSE